MFFILNSNLRWLLYCIIMLFKYRALRIRDLRELLRFACNFAIISGDLQNHSRRKMKVWPIDRLLFGLNRKYFWRLSISLSGLYTSSLNCHGRFTSRVPLPVDVFPTTPIAASFFLQPHVARPLSTRCCSTIVEKVKVVSSSRDPEDPERYACSFDSHLILRKHRASPCSSASSSF